MAGPTLKAVEGFPHYFVSDDGGVWTTWPLGNPSRRSKGPQVPRRMKLHTVTASKTPQEPRVNLNKDGSRFTFRASQLIVEAFIRKMLPEEFVCFLDGDRHNLSISNLKIESGLPPEGIEYRYIPDSRDYYAGDDGKIYRKHTTDGGTKFRFKEVKPHLSSNRQRPYTGILLLDGREMKCNVGRAVALAFHGRCPLGKEACHNDGNPFNNHPDNLRWDTHAGNCADKKAHGTHVEGEIHVSSRLTEDRIRWAHDQVTRGRTKKDVAKELRVSETTVGLALNGKTWKHLNLHD